jgi:hypothetical protein
MSFSAAPVLLAVSSEPRRCPLRCGRAGRVVVQANKGADPYFLSTPGSAARFAHEPTTRNPPRPDSSTGPMWCQRHVRRAASNGR